MRLNLGCGDLRRDGWVNIDLRSDCADVVADVTCLPYADGSVDEVAALDLLEHFPPADTDRVLGEWSRVLRSGGVLEVKVPNMRRLSAAIAANDDRWAEMAIVNIYGGHRWGPDGAWDCHHAGWTPGLLTMLLDRHGFTVESQDDDFNFTTRAVKR